MWLQSAVPAGFDGVTYAESGWTVCESAISAAIKHGTRRLDLQKRTAEATAVVAHDGTAGIGSAAGSTSGTLPSTLPSGDGEGRDASPAYSGGYWKPSRRLEHVCASKRPAPMLPEAASALFQTTLRFTEPRDADVVSEVYRSFFESVVCHANTLCFASLGWGVAEATALAAALPRFRALTSLDVSHNALGADGGSALCACIGAMPHLSTLNVSETDLGAAGGHALATAIIASASLTSVDASMNIGGARLGEAVAFGVAMAGAIAQSVCLVHLSLSSNNLGDGESDYVRAEEVQVPPACSGGDGVGEGGSGGGGDGGGGVVGVGRGVVYQGRTLLVTVAHGGELKLRPSPPDLSAVSAIAQAISASPSLTSIDLAENQLGAAGGRLAALWLAKATAPLTRVDMRENYLGDVCITAAEGGSKLRWDSGNGEEVEAVLRAAVQGREPACVLLCD